MSFDFFDCIQRRNNTFADNFLNFCEDYVYLDGISNKLGYTRYVAQKQNESSIVIAKSKSNNVEWKNTVSTVIKIVSYFIFPGLVVVALIGKAIHRRISAYYISNDSSLSTYKNALEYVTHFSSHSQSDLIKKGTKSSELTMELDDYQDFKQYFFDGRGCLQKFYIKNLGIKLMDISYCYPPNNSDKKIDSSDFKSPFSEKIWTETPEHVEQSSNGAKDELLSFICSYREALDFINKQPKMSNIAKLLKDLFEVQIKDIENFLEGKSETLFHQSKEVHGINVRNIFAFNDFIQPLLFALEAELGITASFRGFLKQLFRGIRGEIKTTRKELADQLKLVIDYFAERGFKCRKSKQGGSTDRFFGCITDALLNRDHISVSSSCGNILYEHIKLMENKEDTSDLLDLCYAMGNQNQSHSVGVIKLNNKLSMFDNDSDNSYHSRHYKKEYSTPQVTIKISKNLYEKLKLDQLDVSNWLTPTWMDANCYASADVTIWALMDLVIHLSGGCHINNVERSDDIY